MTPERQAALETVAARYAVAVPDASAQLIDRGDPDDPIARQFVPDVAELDHQLTEDDDPIGDTAHSPVEGIVHRYPDRVLLKATHVCAVYCRFCFRREMVGPGKPKLSHEALEHALDYIREHSEIWEVILTGGDPLSSLGTAAARGDERARKIDHVKVVRIHTRVPIADPARITRELVRAMKIRGQGDLCRGARQSCAGTDGCTRVRRAVAWRMPAFRYCRRRCCWPALMTHRK